MWARMGNNVFNLGNTRGIGEEPSNDRVVNILFDDVVIQVGYSSSQRKQDVLNLIFEAARKGVRYIDIGAGVVSFDRLPG